MELDPQVSPEEIMSREVELDPQVSPEEIKRMVVELDPQVSPEEIMSREVELDSQVSPEEIMSREVELACEGWTSFASGVVPQQQCSGHCLCDSAHAPQLKQQLRSALVAGQWRGDTALTLPLFWRRSTVSPVFFGRYPRSSLSLSCPLPPSRSTVSQVFFGRYPRSSLHSLAPPPPPHPPSLISNLASVDVKQNGQGRPPPLLKWTGAKYECQLHDSY